jgi:ubiquinol-cytochrome c reductase iron-sulfur subunit
MAGADKAHGAGHDGGTRRDFLILTGGAFSAVGAAAIAWPLINSMGPAADTRAASTTDVDLGPVKPGQSITVRWQGKPVFIRHRTAEEIARAVKDDTASLPDRQADEARVQKPQWLIVVGKCTHLGCVPKGQTPGDVRGDYQGWYCPCHGSHYDISGRIRRGPAPKNLEVPPYRFQTDTQIVIGEKPKPAA